ncbi:unnamed protein product [Sphenostylis stenocarpa]|uniref:Uncharacterized protein n=1 Tax=Sphenostylis stenocarpa TaxID=92480 RepID=A0AA86VDY6_9FABA|nr:unnamed protein product [Sphenostylis stenocarpa]
MRRVGSGRALQGQTVCLQTRSAVPSSSLNTVKRYLLSILGNHSLLIASHMRRVGSGAGSTRCTIWQLASLETRGSASSAKILSGWAAEHLKYYRQVTTTCPGSVCLVGSGAGSTRCTIWQLASLETRGSASSAKILSGWAAEHLKYYRQVTTTCPGPSWIRGRLYKVYNMAASVIGDKGFCVLC